jgi:hypothetical protein
LGEPPFRPRLFFWFLASFSLTLDGHPRRPFYVASRGYALAFVTVTDALHKICANYSHLDQFLGKGIPHIACATYV